MKLYSAAMAPNPRRIVMMLAEKGIQDVEIINLDLAGGDNLTEEFRQRNPVAKVPVLETDSGLCISECQAIYRYLEEVYPQPVLLGRSAEEKAVIEMWDSRVEHAFFVPVGHAFQHSTGFFADRMTPVAEWGSEAAKVAAKFLPVLEAQLSENEFVAGANFSVADITTLCTLEFAKVIRLRAGEEYPAINRWYQAMQQRASYTA